jgi:aspartate carbamoyltransferase regulatory subunit
MTEDSRAFGLSVDRITSGYVIDHIKAGMGLSIYKHLKLDELESSVALIQNVYSNKREKKDMIKIQGLIDIDLDMLGFIDPDITVITVENKQIKGKQRVSPPPILKGVVKCKNPRCITRSEEGLEHKFIMTDSAAKIYKCMYCEQEIDRNHNNI